MSNKIITDYFNHGKIETSFIKYIPMDFNVRFGFPIIAKIAIGIIVFVFVVLSLILFWVIKKYRQHRLKLSLIVK